MAGRKDFKPESDSLNVQVPGENGELEPFVSAHNAEFVGLLMAYQFRRSGARVRAVNYGTAHNMGAPPPSVAMQEVAFYYHLLRERAERESKSSDLYEEVVRRQIEVETWLDELEPDMDEEERRELLIKIDKRLVEIEEMTTEMEQLADA